MRGRKEKDMLDTTLHLGTEHPTLLWIGVSSLLSFVAGVGLGRYSRAESTDETAESVPEPTEG